MKRFRKMCSVLLCAVFLCSCFGLHFHAETDLQPQSASADSLGGSVDVPASPVVLTAIADRTTASPGDTVKVTLTVSENSGLVSGSFVLSHNDAQLTYVSCEKGTALPSDFTIVQNPENKTVTVSRSPAENLVPITGGGSLLIVTFTVKNGTEGQSLSVLLSADSVKGNQGDVALDLQQKAKVESVCKIHEFVGEVTTAEANCISPKSRSQFCKKCNKQVVITEGEALGHQWGEWTVDAAPTCSSAGKQTHKCGRAECPTPVETVDISPLPHTWAADVKVVTAPTCLAEGIGEGTCTVCGAKGAVVLAALGHSYTNVQLIAAPTCTDTGFSRGICERCGDTTPVFLEPLGHKVAEWIIDDSVQCLHPGIRRGTCSTCNRVIEEYLERMEHVYANPVVIKPATDTEFGEQEVTCVRCGQKGLQLIPPLSVESPPDSTDVFTFQSSSSAFENTGETTDGSVTSSLGKDSDNQNRAFLFGSVHGMILCCSAVLLLVGIGLVIFFVFKKKKSEKNVAESSESVVSENLNVVPIPAISESSTERSDEESDEVNAEEENDSESSEQEGLETDESVPNPVPESSEDIPESETKEASEETSSEAENDSERSQEDFPEDSSGSPSEDGSER